MRKRILAGALGVTLVAGAMAAVIPSAFNPQQRVPVTDGGLYLEGLDAAGGLIASARALVTSASSYPRSISMRSMTGANQVTPMVCPALRRNRRWIISSALILSRCPTLAFVGVK